MTMNLRSIQNGVAAEYKALQSAQPLMSREDYANALSDLRRTVGMSNNQARMIDRELRSLGYGVSIAFTNGGVQVNGGTERMKVRAMESAFEQLYATDRPKAMLIKQALQAFEGVR